MLKRFVALLICMLFLPSASLGDTISAEEAQRIVEGLFAASAGVEYQSEASLRKGMSREASAQRDAELAEYRRKVFPWLVASILGEQAGTEKLSAAYEAMQGNEMAQHYFSMLEAKQACTPDQQLALGHHAFHQWLAEVDHEALSGTNHEYACWVCLPGTPIDYPVVHSDNNDYYLRHLFDGTRNASGTLFIDYRNLPGFQDPNTLIYGHHMRNGTMFGTLVFYDKPGYAAAHPYLLVLTPDSLLLAEPFAGYVTSSSDHCYDIAISDADDLRQFEEAAQRKSSFTIPMEFSPSDRLVTLSTCAYAFENARYILIGKINFLWRQEAVAN